MAVIIHVVAPRFIDRGLLIISRHWLERSVSFARVRMTDSDTRCHKSVHGHFFKI